MISGGNAAYTLGGSTLDNTTTGAPVIDVSSVIGGSLSIGVGNVVSARNQLGGVAGISIDGNNSNFTVTIDTVNVTAANGGAGVSIASIGTGGGVVINDGAIINNSTGNAFEVNGGAGSVSYGGSITDDAGRAVVIANTTGGVVALSGAITDSGSGILLDNVDGDATFGDLTLDASGLSGIGIDLSGASGAVSFNDVDITNLGSATAVSTAGSGASVTMNTLDISGSGVAGSIGVDITGSTGSLAVTNAGTVQNVETAFELDRLGSGTTNSTLSFQGGAINAGVPVNTVGITAGSYDFTGTTMIKNSALSTATGFGGDFWFADATGGGTGTSSDRANADFVEANSAAGDVIALVDDGTGSIAATGGFQMKADQQLIGFATGDATVDFTGANPQVLGTFQYQISDPTGNGAVTLTNAGGTEAVSLADNTRLRGFDVTTSGAVDAIAGNGISGASVTSMAISGAGGNAFNLVNPAGTVIIADSSIIDSAGAGLRVSGGDAVITLNNTTISDTGSGRSVDIQGTSGGSVSFDAASTVSNSNGAGIFLDNIGGDVSFDGAVSVTGAISDAVTAINLGAATVAFTNGLNVTTTAGRGLVGSGGTINVNTGSIDATGGEAVDIDGSSVGMSVTSLASTNSTDSGVDLNNVTGSINVSGTTTVTNATNAGIDITGGSGSKTFGTVTINRQGVGINIDGGDSTIQFGQTTVTNPGDVGLSAISVANTSGGNVRFADAAHNIDQAAGAAAAIYLVDNAAGFDFDGGAVTTAAGGSDAAIYIGGAQAGVTFGASGGTVISQTGAGRLLDIVNVTGGNSLLFSANGALSSTAAGNGGIDIANTNANVTIANATLDNTLGNAVSITGGSGQMNLTNVDINNAGGNGVSASNLAGTLLFQGGGSISNTVGDGINVNGGGAASVVQILGGAATNDFIGISGNAISVTDTTGTVTLSDVQADAVTGQVVYTNNTGDVAISNGLTLAQIAGGTFINQTGTIDISNATLSNLMISGGNAGFTLTGSTLDNATTGTAVIDVRDTTGGTLSIGAGNIITANGSGLLFDNVDSIVDLSGSVINLNSGASLSVQNGSAGTLGFGDITITGGGIAIADSSVSVDFNGAVSIAGASGDGVALSNNTGASIGFNGGLTIDTSGGTAFRATAGGTVSVANAGSETITQSGGAGALRLDGVSVGASGIRFDSITTTGATSGTSIAINNVSGGTFSGGDVALAGTSSGGAGDGIHITGSSANFGFANVVIDNSDGEGIALFGANGDVGFASVDIDGVSGRGIEIIGATNAVTVNAGAIGLATPSAGFAIHIENQLAGSAITFNNVDASSVSADTLNLTNNNGSVNVTGGTLTQGGGNDTVDIDGGAGTVNITSTLAHIGSGALASAVEINGTSGNVTISGDVTNTGGGRLIDIGTVTAIGGGAIQLAGALTDTGGDGLRIQDIDAGASVSLAGPSITNAGGVAIQIGANAGTVAFTGTTTVSGSGGSAIDLSGNTNTGTIAFGDVDITNLGGVTGLSTVGSGAAITLDSLDVAGTSASGSVGVDVTGSTGSLTVTNAGTVQDVVIGFELDRLGTGTTNSTLSFQGGTINAGVPVDTVGITAGSYDFTGTTMIKNNALSTATGFGGDFWFADATGGGTGTSTDRASIDFVETNSASDDIIVLVDDGTGSIIATNGLQLKDSQQLIGFAAGDATVDFTGSNSNVVGTFAYLVSDPTGNGAATLSNSGGTEVVTLANSNLVRDFDLITTGAVDGIAGSGFSDTTINNIAIANAGAEAFDFTNAAGTITVTDSSAINSTGAGLRLNGGNATIALNNFDISDTGSGRSLDISTTTGGSVTFDANSSISNSGGTGVFINNTGGDVTFNGAVSVTSATATAVTATNLNTNVVAFNGGLGTVSTTSGTALNASGGTLNIAGTNTITATGAQALAFNNLTVGDGSGGALTFDTVSSGGGANGIALTNVTAANGLAITNATLAGNVTAGININSVSGTLNITAANVDAGAAATGVVITGANGTLNIGYGGTGLDIDGGTTGVSINQSAGTVNLGSGASGVIAVDGTSGTGMTIAGTGTVNIGSGGGTASIGTTAPTIGTAFAVTGGNAAVSYGGTITNTASRAVSVQNRTGGGVTLAGNIIDTGTGLLLQNNAGGSVNFSGASVSLNTGPNAAVTLSNNTGSTINFTGGGLVINTTSGAGFDATGGGTINVTGTNNSIVSTTGTALNVANTSIGASGLTFHSIAANGAVNGIVLNNTGASGGLSVTGDGATPGSGGTIQNTTGAGISLTNTSDVTLSYLTVTNTASAGITGSGVSGGFTLQGSTIQNTVGHNVGLSAVTGVIDISNNTLLDANEDGGTDFLDENNGIDIANTSGTITSLTVTNNIIQGTSGTTSDVGVALHLDGTTVLTSATVSQNTIQGHDYHAVRLSLDNDDSGDAPVVAGLDITNNVVLSSQATALELNARGASDLTFTVSNNAQISSDFGNGILMNAGDFFVGGDSTAAVTGSILNNTIINVGDAANDRGIDILTQESSAAVVNIDGNNISNVSNGGIALRVRDTSSLDVVVNNNTLTNTDSFGGGVLGLFGETRETTTGCFVITNNTNALTYQLNQSAGTVFNLEPMVGNTGTVNASGTITAVAAGTCARVP